MLMWILACRLMTGRQMTSGLLVRRTGLSWVRVMLCMCVLMILGLRTRVVVPVRTLTMVRLCPRRLWLVAKLVV